jgi:hypothetical protein
MSELFKSLKDEIEAVEKDVEANSKGNVAAGTRVRNSMQKVKNLANEIRVAVLEARKEKTKA